MDGWWEENRLKISILVSGKKCEEELNMRKYLWVFMMFPVILWSSCQEIALEKQQKELEQVSAATFTSNKNKENKVILFFGNSITAGYGLNSGDAYPHLIQRKIDSMGLPYEVFNGGLAMETSAQGRNRINWMLNKDIDVFVMELGMDDLQAGISFEETRANLQAILDTVHSRNPHTMVLLTGLEPDPLPGSNAHQLKNIYQNLASQYNVALVPCLMEGIEGIPDLLQEHCVYPTARGHEIVAQNVWQELQPLLISQGTASSD